MITTNIELLSFDHRVIYDCYLSQAWFNDFKDEYSNQSLWLGNRQADYIVFFASEEINVYNESMCGLQEAQYEDCFIEA